MAGRSNLATVAQQLRRGAIAPLDLVERCLRRIRQFEPEIHAWVMIDEAGARQTALDLGEELRAGHLRGPLHGIPIGIKDIFDVAGWPTKAGSPLRATHVADEDASVVARLRKAGAILLGKTVTTEYACFDPSPTRNPWNTSHTPGGSSSGSAAAVAMGMCIAAVGSQTGGSVTRPASYCGVAGMKPTFGLVDLSGAAPVSFHLDHAGPIARTVGELAAMLDAMTTPQADEAGASAAQRGGYLAAAESARLPKLGVIEPFFMEHADEETRRATRRAIDYLKQGGAPVVELSPTTSYADLLPFHRGIMAVEAATYHRQAFEKNRAAYGPHIAKLIEEGLRTPAWEYAVAIHHLEWYREHAWEASFQVDALLTPATPSAAPARLDTTGDPKFNSCWSYAGLPTVSLPCAVTSDGIPIALQLVGPPRGEEKLLSAAAWVERRIHFEAEPPLLAGH